MATSVTSGFVFGQKTATAGTAVQLDTTEYSLRSLLLIAHSTNTGRVFYGGSDVASSTQKGFIARESVVIEGSRIESFQLSSIYIDVSVSGEGVDFIGERA